MTVAKAMSHAMKQGAQSYKAGHIWGRTELPCKLKGAIERPQTSVHCISVSLLTHALGAAARVRTSRMLMRFTKAPASEKGES